MFNKLYKFFAFFAGLVICCVFLTACSGTKKAEVDKPTTEKNYTYRKTITKPFAIDRNLFLSKAKSLLGTPYVYGSADPAKGLDCSGFIYYLFQQFGKKVPRVSRDFTNEGITIGLEEARAGDIILFTGSDNSTGIVGHMGIITKTGKEVQFIHSASGKNIGVIINTLAGYYKTHFVKVIRLIE